METMVTPAEGGIQVAAEAPLLTKEQEN